MASSGRLTLGVKGAAYSFIEESHHDGADVKWESVEWREKDAVSPAKNKGQCGKKNLLLQDSM
jgi:hypothetical protein